jgi:Uma2 family endonuclease
MGMAVPVYHTADIVRALPDDGNRYETVHGELLVTPSPRLTHQRVVGRLHLALGNFLEVHRVGELLTAPADISWGLDILVQPDLFVASLDETRTLDWRQVQTLLLAVEVSSPSTQRADRFTKRRLYQEVGVPVYWVVDPDRQAIEVWTPQSTTPTLERESVTWAPAGAGAPFVLAIPNLFRPL